MKLQQEFKNFKKHEKHQNFSFSILFLKNDLKWLWMTNKLLNELHVSALKSTHVLELLISLPDNNTNPVSVFSLQSDSLPWQIFSNSIKASSATWIAVFMNEVDLYTKWVISMFDNNCKTQVYNKGIFSDPIINITGGEIVTV